MQHQYKTPNGILVVYILFLMIVFLLSYFLFCQPDGLNLDGILVNKGVLWQGVITNENVNQINERYNKNFTVDTNLVQVIIYLGNNFISMPIFYLIISGLGFTIISGLICKLLRGINYDALIFALTIYFSFVSLIFISFFPYGGDTTKESNINNEIVRSIVIFILTILSLILIFFITNNIIIKKIAFGKYAYDFAKDIALEDEMARPTSQHFQQLLNQDAKEDLEYIELKSKKKK